ncbi:esterase [Cellulosimicrobium funkei]|nr:esterase [Cellulosimicrobium funkei]
MAAGLTVAALSAAVLAVGPAAAAPAPEDAPVLIGHRGAAGTAPENTIAAFEDGRASGVDFFEIDVQLSADGVPFLFHDNTPARTTNVEEVFPGREDDPITSFTWDELQQLDAGAYFSERYEGEKIPHLDTAAKIATRNTGVFIEIKSPVNSPGIEQVVADSLSENKDWNRLLEAGKIEVLSFDEASNQRFAAIAPEVPLQQLAGAVPDAATLERYATFADSFGTNYRTLDEAGAQRVKDAGLGLGVYTVNSTESYDESVALGVDRVTGDFPIQFSRHERGLKVFPQNTGVQIEDSVNDVPGADLQPETGEHVVLENSGHAAVDVSGWLLRDAANNVLRIGEGYEIPVGGQLRVYTGPGTNAEDAYYNAGTANVLNNGGDSVALWTDRGTLQDTFAN